MTVTSAADFRQILGIRFYVGSFEGLLELSGRGGLIVVPAAPALVDLPADRAYREACEGATFAITDSGYLVLLWTLFKFETLNRVSGLRWLRGLLEREDFRRPGGTFWVMPSREDQEANLAYLRTQGLAATANDCHLAPVYPKGEITDPDLLAIVEKRRPAYVVLNIGGGVQERLGYFLHKNLSYRPTIVCTGAAIAFLSGRQAKIPVWADRLMLGWFMRILEAPSKFWPRYKKAFALAPLLWRHGSASVG